MKYSFNVTNFQGELAIFLLQSGVSLKQIKKLRKKVGLIKLNGQTAFTNALVKNGDQIEIFIEDNARQQVPNCNISLDILYEDQHFCVINKQAGVATIATRRHFGNSLQNALANHWGNGFVFHPVNRLDKDTSGLMIVAKNSYVHHLFDQMLQKDMIQKSYFAVVQGELFDDGVIEQPILDVQGQVERIVSPSGKYAKTVFKTQKVVDGKTLVDINLQTGRTHQIRVHFSYIGFPLVGDKLYGNASDGIGRQALHAYKLVFNHPIDKKQMVFTSPLPQDMATLLQEK